MDFKFTNIEQFFNQKSYRVANRDWLIAVAIFVGTFAALMLVRKILLKQLKHYRRRKVAGLIYEVLKATHLIFFIGLSLYFSTLGMQLPLKIRSYVDQAFTVAFLLQVASWGGLVISLYVRRYRERNIEVDGASVMSLNLIGFIIRWIFYSVIVLIIFDSLGINITALVAGLGISGIAVALAAQNLLKDLFASVAIVLDKPFVIGDFIVIDQFKGNVEAIGVKTTRIRSLSGEQIIMPNSNLIESRIRNYKRMETRRVDFKIGVVYQTSAEKLRMIPEYIEQIIHRYTKTRFDRASLTTFGSNELIFEVVYFVLETDYNLYATTHQSIMLDIIKIFHREEIQFAVNPQVSGASTV